MPLNPATLTDEILKITDAAYPGWGGWPASNADARDRWAAAFRVYMEEIATPPFIPPSHIVAEAAFVAAWGVAGFASLQAGCAAYVATLAALPPVPPPVYVIVPAPGLFVVPVLPPTINPAPPAAALCAAIDTWTRTGTWSIGAPPAPWV